MDSRKAPIIAFVFIISLWEIIDYLFSVKEVILPNPHEIFLAIVNKFSYLMKHTGITMIESIGGFILGAILALLIAVLFVYSKPIQNAFYPYAIGLKATPLYVLAPLLVLWFGNDMLPKIIMSGTAAFFSILVSAVQGLNSVSEESLNLFKSLQASKWQTLIYLRAPNSLPFVFAGLKIASTVAVLGATIAEFTGASEGIGFVIVNSSYYLETSTMFAAIVLISIAGVLFFYSIEYLEKRIIFWN